MFLSAVFQSGVEQQFKTEKLHRPTCKKFLWETLCTYNNRCDYGV